MSNFNFNHVTLAGRICTDLQTKTVNDTYIATFRLAVKRPGKDAKTDFFVVNAYNNNAEFINNFFDKGDAICVCGSIHIDTATAENGSKNYYTNIVVSDAYFVDSFADKQAKCEANEEAAYSALHEQSNSSYSDDDLPF